MSKKHRNPKDITCPECKGRGIIYLADPNEASKCWYCAGTGTATDESSEEKFWEQ